MRPRALNRRILALLGAPTLFALLGLLDIELFLTVVSIVLVLGPAVNFTVAVIITAYVWRNPDAPISLRSRGDDAIVLWVASSLGGILGLNRLASLNLPQGLVLGLLALALILISIPALDWLIVWAPVLMRDARGWWHRHRDRPAD